MKIPAADQTYFAAVRKAERALELTTAYAAVTKLCAEAQMTACEANGLLAQARRVVEALEMDSLDN